MENFDFDLNLKIKRKIRKALHSFLSHKIAQYRFLYIHIFISFLHELFLFVINVSR